MLVRLNITLRIVVLSRKLYTAHSQLYEKLNVLKLKDVY